MDDSREGTFSEDGVQGDELFVVGRVVRPHGVKGELKVVPETDEPDRLLEVDELFLGRSPHTADHFEIESVRFQETKRGLLALIKLKGIDDRSAAQLRGDDIVFAHEDDLPPLEPGEHFIHDLIGLKVRLEDETEIGTVDRVIRQPVHDVFVIGREGASQVMVPAIDEFVIELDVEEGFMVIRPIEGMVE